MKAASAVSINHGWNRASRHQMRARGSALWGNASEGNNVVNFGTQPAKSAMLTAFLSSCPSRLLYPASLPLRVKGGPAFVTKDTKRRSFIDFPPLPSPRFPLAVSRLDNVL